MSKNTDRIKRIEKFFFDENVKMASKNFYLIAGYGIPVVLFFVLMMPLCRYNTYVLIAEAGFALILTALAYLAWRYEEYTFISVIMSFVCSLLIFPVLFVLTGNIYNGIPVFLAATVIMTFFLIDDRRIVYPMAVIELGYYLFLILFCYYNRKSPDIADSAGNTFWEKAMNFVFACMLPVFLVYYQTAIYDRIKIKKEQSYISIRNSELSKIRFLANMTHEIRNPMNAIVGMNELILKEDLTPGAREQAEVIRDASSQLLRIVNNILVYSKLDSNKWEANAGKYSFRQLMLEVIDNVARGMQGEGAEFYVFIDRTIPTYLFGDSQGVKQIFMYLLHNSIQQNQRRSMSLEVKSEKLTSEHLLRFKCRIAETGSGMPEADVDSLLGAFNKYDSRRNATLKGLGLEISICNALLATMDGFLKIESVVGVGTAIIFEFSNYIIDDTPMLAVDESIDRRVLIYLHDRDEENLWKNLMEDIRISPVYAAGPVAFRNEIENHRYTHIFVWEKDYEVLHDILEQTMCEEITYIITDYSHVYRDFGNCRLIRKPLSSLNVIDILNGLWVQEDYIRTRNTERITFPDARVLVVDDSLVNQKVLCSVLDNFNISAKTAPSGRVCLEMLRSEDYDIVLLDQMMPEMDGIETLGKIRRLPGRNSKIPVLCVTAELGRDVGEKLMDEGFDDYIAKPVKDYHLGRLLRRYLPDEMAVIIVDEQEDEPKEDNRSSEPEIEKGDPLEINTAKGIENVGGLEDIYYEILNTYYHEGLEKWKAVPSQFLAGDIQLFTTNVHALKSSSASVGAYNISERFKKLEFAGKENNRGYIEENLDECLEDFRNLLDKVRDILVANGALEEADSEDSELNGLEESVLDIGIITDLQQSLNNVNLKKCEELLDDLVKHNYGQDINSRLRHIKDAYDMFDYHSVKDQIVTLLDSINGGKQDNE